MLPEKTLDKIARLYGADIASGIAEEIIALVNRYGCLEDSQAGDFLTERDILLITYADSLHQSGFEPLKSMIQFCRYRLKNLISIIHLLPFFPYSSDDGFSVIDYRQVDPSHGDWGHIARLGEDFDLCFDLVLNHVSAKSGYFKGYLGGDPQFEEFFIELDQQADTSSVVRPRKLPLVHCYPGSTGEKCCWTTFSRDQVDLNFKNPNVFLEMLDILLSYVSNGARVIRLDAIAYLWKQLGTSCVHLPQTHLVVQLIRDVLDVAAPQVLLLSETNFPHEDNISYFGNGHDEAQIAYNFPLPPLVLHTLTTGSAAHLSRWAETIEPVSDRTAFLNFTASHDGIGVRPAASILSPDEFQNLIDLTLAHGGQISYKSDSHGQPIPYELNINYFDAINNPNNTDTDEKVQIDRFLLSQSIALTFMGVPAIYIHSLIGSRNWTDGVAQTGQARSINREKVDLDLLEQQLIDEDSRRARVFDRYVGMIAQRRSHKAFHPGGSQQILDFGDAVFALVRTSPDHSESVVVLHNVTGHSQRLDIDPQVLQMSSRPGPLTDLIGGIQINPTNSGLYNLTLKPYQFVWLKYTQ